MTTTVRRAGAFALVGTAGLLVPAATRVAPRAATAIAGAVPLAQGVTSRTIATVAGTLPFVAIAVAALYVVDEGCLFELFARPGDREDGRLYGLAGFSLAVAGLALLALQFALPMTVFSTAVFALSYGNLVEHLVGTWRSEPAVTTAGFVVGGSVLGFGAGLATVALTAEAVRPATLVFFAVSGALLASLLRAVLFARDDPLVMVSVALLLWLFADLGVAVSPVRVAVALAVTGGFGYVSYWLDAASVAGMVTGVLLGLLTIVLGGYGWFAMLITFFGVGALSTKFRYEEKQERGIAQENEGVRGSGNVLANSLMALVAVVGFAASPTHVPVPPDVFLYAFAGAVAAAMSDTLSSEIGGLYDHPRLITTFERVAPGTDGGVTWQGELAGVVGAALIAAIAVAFESVPLAGALAIVAAGVLGMTADSLLGATVEGRYLGNQAVNFLATGVAGVVGGGVALALASL
ncbi:MAG: TIGR00297 family protein [Halorientalis sp.]